jgi:hypothetical protein
MNSYEPQQHRKECEQPDERQDDRNQQQGRKRRILLEARDWLALMHFVRASPRNPAAGGKDWNGMRFVDGMAKSPEASGNIVRSPGIGVLAFGPMKDWDTRAQRVSDRRGRIRFPCPARRAAFFGRHHVWESRRCSLTIARTGYLEP